MQFINVLKKWSVRVLVVALLLWIFVFNWSFVFKKKVVGEVVAAEKVDSSVAVVTSGELPLNPQVFSFSVAIKDRFSGEIFMASSEDRQWAAVSKGNCVIAVYFPYPPWNVGKGNTSHNARLLRNFTDCNQIPKVDSFWDSFKFFFLF